MASLYFETCPFDKHFAIVPPLTPTFSHAHSDTNVQCWVGACPRFSVYASLYRGLVLKKGFPLSALLELMSYIGDNDGAQLLIIQSTKPLSKNVFFGCHYLVIAMDRMAMNSLLNADDFNVKKVSPIRSPVPFYRLVHHTLKFHEYEFMFRLITLTSYKMFLIWPRNVTKVWDFLRRGIHDSGFDVSDEE